MSIEAQIKKADKEHMECRNSQTYSKGVMGVSQPSHDCSHLADKAAHLRAQRDGGSLVSKAVALAPPTSTSASAWYKNPLIIGPIALAAGLGVYLLR